MHHRRRSAAAAVVLALALAGCLGGVTPPEQVAVAGGSAQFDVRDVDVWTSGSTTAYRSQVVVTGTLVATGDDVVALPRVSVRFELGDGEVRTVDATYEDDARSLSYADLANETLAPGDRLGLRAVLDPGGDAVVANATFRVGE